VARSKQRTIAWDWYSVSIDAVRLLLGGVTVVIVLLLGYFGWGRYNEHRLQQKAAEWVAKPETLLRQLRSEQQGAYRAELEEAETRLEGARTAFDRGAWRSAISLGRASFALLEDVLEQVRLGGSIAWFLSVQGDVEYRRGETGPFLRAYPRTELHEDDYVRSGRSSSAEIHFRNEDTVFRLRPGSLIKLTRSSRGGDAEDHTLGYMEYGWVALDTAGTPSSLQTPYTHLRAQQHSLVSIELEEGSRRSQIRVSEGGAQVRDLESGRRTELGEREQIEQTPDGFGSKIELPPHPLLASPPDGFTVNIDATDRVRLEWTPVAGARRYALQVSKNRLFGENVVDAADRFDTEALLAVREEGTYVWRVAAYDGSGALGPWSETRKFRVASYRELALDVDREPPSLEVDIMVNGNIALVVGKTEPGSALAINQEAAAVAADGSFTATRTLWGTGRVAVDFSITDRAGNRTTERRFVFVDEG
jgi:hypothetical protein